jgi:hypothetical protein
MVGLAWLFLTVVASSYAFAQPRTLYKPGDIENARENIKEFDWAKAIVRGWEKSAKFALGKDREFFVAFIPELTPGLC